MSIYKASENNMTPKSDAPGPRERSEGHVVRGLCTHLPRASILAERRREVNPRHRELTR